MIESKEEENQNLSENKARGLSSLPPAPSQTKLRHGLGSTQNFSSRTLEEGEYVNPSPSMDILGKTGSSTSVADENVQLTSAILPDYQNKDNETISLPSSILSPKKDSNLKQFFDFVSAIIRPVTVLPVMLALYIYILRKRQTSKLPNQVSKWNFLYLISDNIFKNKNNWLTETIKSIIKRFPILLNGLALLCFSIFIKGVNRFIASAPLLGEIRAKDVMHEYPTGEVSIEELKVLSDEAAEELKGSSSVRKSIFTPENRKKASAYLTDIKGFSFKKELLRYFQSMRHLGGLSESAWIEFTQKMTCVSLKRNQILYSKGGGCLDGIYVVLEGKIAALTEPELYTKEEGYMTDDAGSPRSRPPSFDNHDEGDVNYAEPYVDPVTNHKVDQVYGNSDFGKYLVNRDNRNILVTYTPGSSVGEEALLNKNSTRCVTTAAITDAVVLRVDSFLYEWLMDKHPSVVAAFLLSTITRHWRVSYFALVDLLSPEAVWRLVSDSSSPAFEPGSPGFESIQSLTKVIRNISPREKLYDEGETADSLYIVLSGSIRTTFGVDKHNNSSLSLKSYNIKGGQNSETVSLNRIFGPGCVVGGVACFAGTEHMESARALGFTQVAVFNRKLFTELATMPQGKSAGKTAQLLDISMCVAASLAPLVREFNSLGMERLYKGAGHTLFRSGDEADSMFIVISGRIRTFVINENKKAKNERWDSNMKRVLEVGRGDVLGELVVLSDERTWNFNAVAVRDSELVRITKVAFEGICIKYPEVTNAFTHFMAKRLHSIWKEAVSFNFRLSASSSSSNVSTVAILPAGQRPPGLKMPSISLALALSQLGPTLHLNRRNLDLKLGEGTCLRLHDSNELMRVSSWLTTAEERYRFIIFEADPTLTEWTKMCMRQADCLLLVGDSDSPPSLSGVEEYIFSEETSVFARIRNNMARKELVILHKDASKHPRSTRNWLKIRPVRMHHHVRTQTQYSRDFGRLSRMLAGQGIGLVLGGGGARGLAHIGVIAALEEAGVTIDFIGGTSQGACVGGLYAMFDSVAEVKKRSLIQSQTFGSTSKLLSDLTLPIISYFSGVGLNNMLRNMFKSPNSKFMRQDEMQIEDLWIRYCCITTNVSQQKMMVHETGPLWKYVKASMSLLGMFPPVFDGGDLLLDGGYVNNLPVDVVFAMGMETVIACDVENKEAYKGVQNMSDYGDSLSGWWVFAKWMLSKIGASKKLMLPDLSEINGTLFYISSDTRLRDMIEQGERSGKVLYLRPDEINSYGLTDYNRIDEITKRGFDTAKRLLPEFRNYRLQLLEQSSNPNLQQHKVKKTLSHDALSSLGSDIGTTNPSTSFTTSQSFGAPPRSPKSGNKQINSASRRKSVSDINTK